jgi:uncharacterized protein (TIGR02246 family)
MSTKIIIVISLWSLLAACGCIKKQVDFAAEEQAIRAISLKWLEIDKARDAAGQVALFADDGTVFRENEGPYVGHSAIQNYYTHYYEKNPDYVPSWGTDHVKVAASGDLAVEYGSWQEKNSDGTQKDYGKYITVYRKMNGAWKVAADMSLSTKPEEGIK